MTSKRRNDGNDGNGRRPSKKLPASSTGATGATGAASASATADTGAASFATGTGAVASVIGNLADHDNISRYSINTLKTIGDTPLVMGYDVSVVPPERITAKYVESSATAAFMATEGRVYHALSNQPHPHMPHVRCCLRASDGKERSYVISDAYFGDLQSYMRSLQLEESHLPEAQALCLFSQLVDALVYCHSNRIVLRDMKLGKVMFSDANHTRIVIADLTNAVIMPVSVNVVHDQQGSPAYVAPEVLSGRPYDPFKTDIWSLGIMMFVLLTGRYPFRDVRPSVLFHKIANGLIEFPADSSVSTETKNLVLYMLTRNPALRPSIEEIRKSLVISGDEPGGAMQVSVVLSGAMSSAAAAAAAAATAGTAGASAAIPVMPVTAVVARVIPDEPQDEGVVPVFTPLDI
jgi:serine/threonine protein kinase